MHEMHFSHQHFLVRSRELRGASLIRVTYLPLECITFKDFTEGLAAVFFWEGGGGAKAPSGPGPFHDQGCTITLRHTTLCRTPLDE